MVYAALSEVFHGLAAMLLWAALSGGYVTHAAMLLWAALSDGYGEDACCDGSSLEFLNGDGCRNLLCHLAGLLRLKESLPLLYERSGPAAAMLTLLGRGENIRFLVLFEMVQCALCAENWVPGSSSQETVSLYEVVEIESDYEPEPPCTMVNCHSTDVFDIQAEAHLRGLDEHELTHMVFEFGQEEGMRKMAELTEGDASSVVFQGGVVQEPRVC